MSKMELKNFSIGGGIPLRVIAGVLTLTLLVLTGTVSADEGAAAVKPDASVPADSPASTIDQAVPVDKPASFVNDLGMEFVWIQPGSFIMGSPATEQGRYDDETQHQVTLTRGFYLQTTEVTQGQWRAIMGGSPSYFQDCGDNCPVEQVSWNDAQEFIRRLSRQTGRSYRLPTEAEWEYACRAGTSGPFNAGDCLTADQADFDGKNPLNGCPQGRYIGKPVPVKSFPPNVWGLYDMHGNVGEWCADWFGDYPAGSVTDPAGPSSGRGRVFRGGSWKDQARNCRSAERYDFSPGDQYYYLGFRLAVE